MLEQMKSTADSIQTDGENAHETESGEDTSSGQLPPGTETELLGSDVTERVVDTESIGYDQLFELLKNKRRRRVLQYLLDVDDEITLDVLAERIAAEENGKDIKQISSQERKRVYVGLYQCHLPKMDDWGAISYNKPRGKISAAENTELFGHYLPDETDTDERGWGGYRSGLPLALALLFLTSTLLGAVGVISMPQLVVVSFVATVISISMLQFSR
jgi:hypothetical protein